MDNIIDEHNTTATGYGPAIADIALPLLLSSVVNTFGIHPGASLLAYVNCWIIPWIFQNY